MVRLDFVSKGDELINALSKLVGETHSEQEKDNNGKLKFKYNDGKKRFIFISPKQIYVL